MDESDEPSEIPFWEGTLWVRVDQVFNNLFYLRLYILLLSLSFGLLLGPFLTLNVLAARIIEAILDILQICQSNFFAPQDALKLRLHNITIELEHRFLEVGVPTLLER